MGERDQSFNLATQLAPQAPREGAHSFIHSGYSVKVLYLGDSMDRRELREKRRRMMEEDDSGASSEVARAGPAKRSKPTASSS